MFDRDAEALYFGVTALENLFILEFMPNAKGDYVKVYLLGLYHSAHPNDECDILRMSHELGMKENDVEAALRYWERKRLVTRVKDDPPTYIFHKIAPRILLDKDQPQADELFVSFSEDVYSLFGDRRKVTPGEIAYAYEWVQDLGLSPEAVLKLMQHCIDTRGVQFSFKTYAQKIAVDMKEAGVTEEEDAEKYLARSRLIQQGARDVLRRMGKRRQPSEDELNLYNRWVSVDQIEPGAILSACAKMTNGDPSFNYLDKIILGMAEQGARTQSAVQQKMQSDDEQMARIKALLNALGLQMRAIPPTVRAIYSDLNSTFSHDMMMLAAHQVQRVSGQGTLDQVSDLLSSWEKRGLTDVTAAQEYIDRFNSENTALRRLFEIAGCASRPTAADRANYERWLEWGYGNEMQEYAASLCTQSDNKPAYMNSILKAWHDENVHTTEEAKAQREKHAERYQKDIKVKKVSATNYQQREYTKEELDALAADMMKEVLDGNGR